MELKVGLLSSGSWETAVASLVAKNCNTKIWARRQATVDDIVFPSESLEEDSEK